MKVLLINVNCNNGSTGKIVYDLYNQCRENGHAAAIAYGRGPKVKGEHIYRISPQWEVYLHAALTRITGYTGCFSYIATRRLFKLIEKFQPDVVHLHVIHGYFVNVIPLIEYLKKKNIKTVWTQHCEYAYTGKCGYAYECEKWKDCCGACPNLKDYPKAEFFDHTKKMFLRKKQACRDFNNLSIVTPSVWLANRVKESFLKDKRVQVVYNGVDTTIFHKRNTEELRKKYALTDEKVVLAAAPNLMSERKGGAYVVELAGRMKDKNIKFILVGIKDTNSICGENIIAEEVIKDQNLLAQYYSLADVFVICSKKENYPTVCVEAAACKTPVVGFDTGGTAETVEAANGCFVEYGNIDALEKALEKFLEKKEKQEDLADVRDYSKKGMYEAYLKIYTGEGDN